MRRMTKKAWFGPKKYLGWGWRVETWQGAVVLLAFSGVLIAVLAVSKGPVRIVATVVIIAALAAVAFLTGDPPGGPHKSSNAGR